MLGINGIIKVRSNFVRCGGDYIAKGILLNVDVIVVIPTEYAAGRFHKTTILATDLIALDDLVFNVVNGHIIGDQTTHTLVITD